MKIRPGSIVLVHLIHPSEKFWGVLEELEPAGLTIRGLGLDSFGDWLRELADHEPCSLGLATMFVPLARVERIFLDEPVGAVQSYCQQLEQRLGRSVAEVLGLRGLAPEVEGDVDGREPS